MIGRKMKATKRSVIMNQEFWTEIDQLVCDSNIVIGRPNGSVHPKYADFNYKVDYGYWWNRRVGWQRQQTTD